MAIGYLRERGVMILFTAAAALFLSGSAAAMGVIPGAAFSSNGIMIGNSASLNVLVYGGIAPYRSALSLISDTNALNYSTGMQNLTAYDSNSLNSNAILSIAVYAISGNVISLEVDGINLSVAGNAIYGGWTLNCVLADSASNSLMFSLPLTIYPLLNVSAPVLNSNEIADGGELLDVKGSVRGGSGVYTAGILGSWNDSAYIAANRSCGVYGSVVNCSFIVPAERAQGLLHIRFEITDSLNDTLNSTPVTLMVYPELELSTSRNVIRLDSGQSIGILANASGGTGDTAYAWSVPNSLAIGSGCATGSACNVSAETPGTYIIKAMAIDNGTSEPQASTTKNISVAVMELPHLAILPSIVYTDYGENAIISADAGGGTGSFAYQWSMNGMPVEGAKNKTLSVGEPPGAYNITLSAIDIGTTEGAYPLPMASAYGLMLVHPRPSLKSSLPLLIKADKGQKLQYNVSVPADSGVGPFSIEIVSDGNTLSSNDVLGGTTTLLNYVANELGNMPLEIIGIDKGTSVPYAFGSINSTLLVRPAPVVQISKNTLILDSGERGAFRVRVENGTGPFSIEVINASDGASVENVTGLSSGNETDINFTASLPANASASETYGYALLAKDTGTTLPFEFNPIRLTLKVYPALSVLTDYDAAAYTISNAFPIANINSNQTYTFNVLSYVAISGGTGNYTYSWDTSGLPNNSFRALSCNTYLCTIKAIGSTLSSSGTLLASIADTSEGNLSYASEYYYVTDPLPPHYEDYLDRAQNVYNAPGIGIIIPSAGQIIYALGLSNEVVAMSGISDAALKSFGIVPSAIVQNIGSPCCALSDFASRLIYAGANYVPVDAGAFEGTLTSGISMLEAGNIVPAVLGGDFDSNITAIENDVMIVANETGRYSEGVSVAGKMDKILSAIKSRLGGSKSESVAMIAGWYPPMYIDGSVSFIGSEIGAANGKDVFGGFYPSPSPEDLLYKNPEYIIAAIFSYPANISATYAALESMPGITESNAWKDGKVYILGNMATNLTDEPGPLSVYGALLYAAILHPEEFGLSYATLPHNITSGWVRKYIAPDISLSMPPLLAESRSTATTQQNLSNGSPAAPGYGQAAGAGSVQATWNGLCYSITNMSDNSSATLLFGNIGVQLFVSQITSNAAEMRALGSVYALEINASIGIGSGYTARLLGVNGASGRPLASLDFCSGAKAASIAKAVSATINGRVQSSNTMIGSVQGIAAPELSIANSSVIAGGSDEITAYAPMNETVAILVNGTSLSTGNGTAVFNAGLLGEGMYGIKACAYALGKEECSAVRGVSVRVAGTAAPSAAPNAETKAVQNSLLLPVLAGTGIVIAIGYLVANNPWRRKRPT